jgi:hypothetical protein
MNNNVHQTLLKKMHEYFDVNLHWEGKQTHTAGIELRRLLSDIRNLCSERRKEIQAVREQKPKLKSPKYKNSISKGSDDQLT